MLRCFVWCGISSGVVCGVVWFCILHGLVYIVVCVWCDVVCVVWCGVV